MHEEITIPELTEVVARLAALLGPRQGGVTLLEGGISNRNYRVNFGGTDYVVRLLGKKTELLGANREAERLATGAAAELGIAPRVAAVIEDPPCLVTSFIRGRLATPEELRREDRIEVMARALRAFHDSGITLPSTFDALELVERYAGIATERGVELPDGYEAARAHATAARRSLYAAGPRAPVPCHNDLLAENCLLEGERIKMVDWEYAGMGDRFFDLGNFAGNSELDEEQTERLLSTYIGEPPDDCRRARLELFRFLSNFREGMWAVVEMSIAHVAFDFSGYAAKHFDRLAKAGADPRFEGWVAAAATQA
jgi:thiamine kinase-like enzyme